MNRARSRLRRGSAGGESEADFFQESAGEESEPESEQLDRSDPEVFRNFLRDKCGSLSRAWNFVFTKRKKGKSFNSVETARFAHDNAGTGSEICAAAGENYFTGEGGGGGKMDSRGGNQVVLSRQKFFELVDKKLDSCFEKGSLGMNMGQNGHTWRIG